MTVEFETVRGPGGPNREILFRNAAEPSRFEGGICPTSLASWPVSFSESNCPYSHWDQIAWGAHWGAIHD